MACSRGLCDPMHCSPPGSSVHGITQARILEWVAFSFPGVSSWPRDQIHVSYIGMWILYHWVTRETRNIYCKKKQRHKKWLICFQIHVVRALPWVQHRSIPKAVAPSSIRIILVKRKHVNYNHWPQNSNPWMHDELTTSKSFGKVFIYRCFSLPLDILIY